MFCWTQSYNKFGQDKLHPFYIKHIFSQTPNEMLDENVVEEVKFWGFLIDNGLGYLEWPVLVVK